MSRGSGQGCGAIPNDGGNGHGAAGRGHGGSIDATADIDIGEAAVALICITALFVAAWMAYWTVLSAPTLFAELLLDSALATGLYRHLRRARDRDWVHTALRRTALRFTIVAIVCGLAGTAMQFYAPEASSIGQVIHHHKPTESRNGDSGTT